MQLICKTIVDSRLFQAFILILILLASAIVGLETYKEIKLQQETLFAVLDFVIILLFAVEAALKMGAHGRHWYRYFKDPWNIFDFTIVVICFLPFNTEFAAVARLARILRAFRVVSVLPQLQMLVGALLKSLPSMIYVGLLLSVLFYIYAVVGTNLWGAGDPHNWGTIGASMLTLFKVVTLEGWTEMMDYQITANAGGVGGISTSVVATMYFVSFILLGTMIMLNLFIGVILKSMDEVAEEEQKKARAEHIATTGKTTLDDDVAELEDRQRDLLQLMEIITARMKKERGTLSSATRRVDPPATSSDPPDAPASDPPETETNPA